MRSRFLIFVLSALAFCCCSEVDIPSDRQELVIEGWIEDGRFPVVIVTTSLPVSTEYQDWTVLEENLVRWAKVSVSDGEREVVLTGKLDWDYFPPYVYTTSRMTGEAGKTYKLKVEYGGRVETAETTVPERVPLEYVKVVELEGGYGIVAGLKDNPQTKDYFRFFTMIEGVDSTYVPSFMGLVDDSVLTADEVNEVSVFGAFVANFGSEQRAPTFFFEEDVVRFRLSNMDEASFNYWEDYDDVSSLSMNPFFPVNKKIRSNVSSGMGCWAGYGSSYYTVSIADSLALGRVWPAVD